MSCMVLSGCWEPTSLLITQLFQHTYYYYLFLCRFAINIKNEISGWLILECRDRLHVISRIFERSLSTATVTMSDIVCFFSCGSADCHDCSTPGRKRRNRSDDADEVGELPMQIDHDLESQINSWVDNDIHEDDQSSVHSTINHDEDQPSVQVINQTSTQDHTSADANPGSTREVVLLPQAVPPQKGLLYHPRIVDLAPDLKPGVRINVLHQIDELALHLLILIL